MRTSAERRRLVLALTLTDERRVSRARVFEVVPGYAELPRETRHRYLERDLALLRTLGFDISVQQGSEGNTYYYSLQKASASTPEFSAAEQTIIREAAANWSWSAGGPAVLAKAQMLSGGTQSSTDAHLESPEQTPKIIRAIEDKRIIRFEYESRSGAAFRTVLPWQIVVRGRALYLWAADLEKEAPRLFRISRIKGAVETLEASPARQQLAAQLEEVPFSEEGVFEVAPVLLVKRGAAPLVRLHCQGGPVDQPPGQQISAGVSDDWELLQGETRFAPMWERLILEHITEVVVVEPIDLRQRILACMEGLAHGTQ